MDFGAGIRKLTLGALAISSFLLAGGATPSAAQAAKRPNILVIMGDDVGWFNIGAYHRGIMSGKTPNLDKLASQGMMFTDYYAEASCTAGRANFITGELPIRTGLTTVGQAGADVGMPAQAITLATILKAQGYETGQFGKNHLGDLNKFLPCLHGFDEFFGYLYHLDAMSDPYWFDYPQDWIDKTGPRNLTHCWATDKDDATVQPRWGAIGKQKIVDEGPLAPFPNMTDMQNWQKGRPANQLLKGAKFGDRTYKNHLDGYDQTALITGTGPSARHEIFYFGGPHLGAIRIDDFKFQFFQQPWGWPGEKVTTDMPTIVNIRQDPFERTPSIRGESPNNSAFGYGNEFFAREFWRFVLVQQYVGKMALTAVDYPPMQDPATFNLDAIKAKIQELMKAHEGQ